MAAKFRGTREDLASLLAQAGLDGEWSEIQGGFQFRTKDEGVLDWYSVSSGKVTVRGRDAGKERLARFVSDFIETAVAPAHVSEAGAKEDRRVFVVHGHDPTAREQTELVLHRLGLDPFVLANTGGGGLTLIEALEKEISGPTAQRFGIVLLTPDDFGFVKGADPVDAEPRARQNVVLEMGMLIAALGRPRVAILKKGHLEVPSDAAGVIYIPFNDHVKETVPRLADRLREAGFDIGAAAISKAMA